VAGLASIRLGHGLRPFPRLIAAHFASPGLCCAKPLSGLAKRRKQPERWAINVLNQILVDWSGPAIPFGIMELAVVLLLEKV
ncbi:MAG: hypothetical protein LBD18_02710, partial [Treponema sp.]|nr:hypothetical protein [Treponema sp.]